MDLKAPRGTRDILPEEAADRQYLECVFADLCSRYGYGEIRVPAFEHTELFVRGVGDSTDVVRKEMYTFADRSNRSLTLRPEGTAGVARAYIEHGMSSWPAPVKLWYRMNMFRYEKMQKGRYREHWQLGCEVFGSEAPQADAELIGLLDSFFQALGLVGIQPEINSIGCPACREAYREILRDYYRPHLPSMCDDCQVRFERNPLRMLDCKEASCQALAGQAPAQLDHLCQACRDHFDQVKRALDRMGISYLVNPHMVRGLDYYTRTVFEFMSDNVGTQGSICGGGRYDGLVSQIGGLDTPAVGFAMGLERLMLEMEAQAIQIQKPDGPDLYIASFPETAADALLLTRDLIRQGFSLQTDIMGRSLKAQMKAADRLEARYILVLGDEELAGGQGSIRKMSDGSETRVSLSEIGTFLKGRKQADSQSGKPQEEKNG